MHSLWVCASELKKKQKKNTNQKTNLNQISDLDDWLMSFKESGRDEMQMWHDNLSKTYSSGMQR